MSPPLSWLEHLKGRTITNTDYEVDFEDLPEGCPNGCNETLILTLDDGSVLSVWSYGYSLDMNITPDPCTARHTNEPVE